MISGVKSHFQKSVIFLGFWGHFCRSQNRGISGISKPIQYFDSHSKKKKRPPGKTSQSRSTAPLPRGYSSSIHVRQPRRLAYTYTHALRYLFGLETTTQRPHSASQPTRRPIRVHYITKHSARSLSPSLSMMQKPLSGVRIHAVAIGVCEISHT